MIARSLVVVIAWLVGAASPAIAASPAVPVLGPDQLMAGQKAVVRTVFEGTRIDTFQAEIVGVVSGGRVAGSTILARATSPRVVRMGVAAGMSGSPVYVDGKLIGALSSGWSFSREPLFGITPIGDMLRVLDQPTRANVSGSAGPAGLEGGPRERGLSLGPFRWAGEPDQESSPAVPVDSPRPLPLPLAGGLRPEVAGALAPRFLEAGFRLVPGGQAAASAAPTTLEPGSAVAVDVLRGDLQLSAIGTVTYRDGDRVLIFGHPFFGSGEVRLPLSTALITTIVPSQENSFKLGERGVEVGVATQDRRTAVAGTLGMHARLMPIRVDVVGGEGARPQSFRFESIEDRSLAPLLLGAVVLNSMLESGGSGAGQTLRWTLRLYRKGHPPLEIHDVIAGDAPFAELGSAVSGPERFLLNNPFERCVLDSIRVSVESAPGREAFTLRSARVLESAVRPGQDVHVRCDLEAWHGRRSTLDVALNVPEEAPDGGYVLFVGGSSELNRYEAQKLPGRYRPTSLEDAWRRLGRLRDSEGLYASLFAIAPEVTRRGSDYPELPISALALLASGSTAGDPVVRGDLARLDERRVPVDGPLRGQLLLTVNVDRKAP